jgi:hypothetical protein
MKTHHKKLVNPNYFGSYAMPLDGRDVTLTIARVVTEKVINTDGKSADQAVCYFNEAKNPVTGEVQKPMILNSTNRKTIAKLAKSPYVEDWAGIRITIYKTPVRAFGENHDALRIRLVSAGAPPVTPAPVYVPPPVSPAVITPVVSVPNSSNPNGNNPNSSNNDDLM